MPSQSPQESQELTIAVVGGGASGTLAAVQLLRRAAETQLPLHIWLIDRDARHGLGQAYSTTHRGHLLNAAAAKMSALPGEPDHLLEWARTTGGMGPVTGQEFLPRQVYGNYLRDTLAHAELAAQPGGRLTRLCAEVTAIRPGAGRRAARLQLTGGRLDVDADIVILATGNTPARLPFEAPDSDRIIAEPWLPGALDDLLAPAQDPASQQVVIVGTGLTMLDLAIAITDARPGSRVHAVSRHGLLPRSHPADPPAAARPMWLPVVTRATGPIRLAELMWQVRSAITTSPGSWPAVMESLRPHVPALWRRLPEQDKKVFLRSVSRYWEVHRHLMPPATAARITALRQTGRLTVHSGRVLSVLPEPDRLSVLIDAGADTLELEAGWLVNAIGGTTDVAATASPLLRELFAAGLARPDSLRLGIDASPDGRVLTAAGQPSDFLYALGPPLRGLWYETTAIPEIGAQAAELAAQITGARQARRHPGSAA
jgi:uncharacterized NAD(P)/FAD-binding protein YdhS